uniref:Uncharacterized protein n=1 Tax=Arundo donax TaxID=35708 RepID=A0A0A9B5P7_ARUDO
MLWLRIKSDSKIDQKFTEFRQSEKAELVIVC